MAEPSSSERLAFEVVRRVLGVEVEHYDTAGRQGAVDGLIRYTDGRVAALEVTSYSAPERRELEVRLAADKHSWSNPGRWWWTINVTQPDDIKLLRSIYQRAIGMCEAHEVVSPEYLPASVVNADSDLMWLVASSCMMRGYPDVRAPIGGRVRAVMVVPEGAGGFVDEDLSGLHGALVEAFAAPSLAKRIDKVSRALRDERHLFLFLPALGGLPFPVSDAISSGIALPPTPPPLPETVTHLWLAPTHSARVLLWNGRSWSAHYPYDDRLATELVFYR